MKPTSKLNRPKLVAYARATKGSAGDAGDDASATPAPTAGEPAVAVEPQDGAPKPGEGAKSASSHEAPLTASEGTPAAPPDAAAAVPGAADAATAGLSMFGRNKGETMGMPPNLSMGTAPDLPAEETWLPGPKEVPLGDPSAPAPSPGAVPRGDSRSLRKDSEFALVYRKQTFVISRVGAVGTQGTWRVVEYPTLGAAANAYAHLCSRFVADGFSDYR